MFSVLTLLLYFFGGWGGITLFLFLYLKSWRAFVYFFPHSFLLLPFLFFFCGVLSLTMWLWPRTCFAHQVGLKLMMIYLLLLPEINSVCQHALPFCISSWEDMSVFITFGWVEIEPYSWRGLRHYRFKIYWESRELVCVRLWSQHWGGGGGKITS